jgi:metal iron transporter
MLVYRILVLASAVFYYGSGSNGSGGPASLFDAYDLVKENVGHGAFPAIVSDGCLAVNPRLLGAATIFAIGLLASGQV